MAQLDISSRTVIQLRTDLQLKTHLYEQCLKEVDEL